MQEQRLRLASPPRFYVGRRLSSGRPNQNTVLAVFGALCIGPVVRYLAGWDVTAVPWLLAVGVTVFLSLWLRDDPDGHELLLSWCIRIIFAFFIYRLWYGGAWADYAWYDEEGVRIAASISKGELAGLSFKDPSANLATLVGYVYWLLGPSMVTVTIATSLCGFVATTLFVRAARRVNPATPKILRRGFIFFPSILAWTSIIGKDPLVFLALSLVIDGSIGFVLRDTTGTRPLRPILSSAEIAGGVLLCLLLRPHLGLVLIPSLIVALVVGITVLPGGRRIMSAAALALGLMVLPVLTTISAEKVTRGKPLTVEALVRRSGEEVAWERDPGRGSTSGVQSYSTPGQFVFMLPVTLVTLFARPFVWEARGVVSWVAIIDSLLVLSLAIWIVRHIRALGGMPIVRRPTGWYFITLAVALVLMLVGFTGNLAEMVRQRTQMIPALLLLAAFLACGIPRPRRVNKAAL